MTKYLSQFSGGGHVFTPAMMQYDGATGAMVATGQVTDGDEFTTWGVIKCSPKTGLVTPSARHILTISDGTSNGRRINVRIGDGDNISEPNKLSFLCRDADTSVLVYAKSLPIVADNEKHGFFISFNASTGVFFMMVDAITEGHDISTLSSGTLVDGSMRVDLGQAPIFNEDEYDGQYGFVGYCEQELTNWQDFFYADGKTPKQLDTSGWSQFGGVQPKIYNPHGDLRNNLGAFDDFVLTDSVVVGDGGNGPHPLLGLNTDGDATAGDIAVNKSAWVDGLNLIGVADVVPLGITDNVLLHYIMPVGAAGAYMTSNSDALIVDPGITITPTANGALTADGYWYASSGTFQSPFNQQGGGLSAKLTSIRRYAVQGKFGASLPTNTGARIVFNFQSGTNYWYIDWYWTGSQITMRIVSVLSGTGTVRASFNFSTAVDLPMFWEALLYDHGDNVAFTLLTNETGAGIDTVSNSIDYSMGSRPLQSEVGFIIGINEGPTDVFIKSATIADI